MPLQTQANDWGIRVQQRLKLHSYFRSSASYRVRIALNLKGLEYDYVACHLRQGQHRSADYLGLNPQGLVPALEADGEVLTQSLAICEYLDDLYPQHPLLPADPLPRARVRAFAQAIACEIHPLQNLAVLQRLRTLGVDEQGVRQWVQGVIERGFDACSELLATSQGRFCFGDEPGLADVFLVPQLFNARRYEVELRWPRLVEIEADCLALEAFRAAAPENQPDAENN
jgi:maleylpyruvate isomerase